MAGRYRQLKALKESNAPKPAIHWANYVLPLFFVVFFGGYILLAILLAAHGIQNAQDNLNAQQNLY
jgi:hypothetical protein